MHLLTGQSIRDIVELANPDLSPTLKSIIAKRSKAQGTEMKRQSDNQADLERDLGILIRQVKDLSAKLPAAEQLRVKNLEKKVAEFKLRDNLNAASQKLRTLGYVENRVKEFKTANDMQWKSAGNLQELARTLRPPTDELSALKEARARIEEAIAKQEEIRKEIKEQDDKQKDDKVNPKDGPDVPKGVKDPDDPKKLQFPDLNPLPKLKPAQANAAEKKA